MSKYLGSCLCGEVRFEISGEFDRFFLCHCQYCQKDTGSAHAANLFSRSAQLTWLSGAEAVTAFTLGGTRHSKCFCKVCGSALPNTLSEDLLVVPAGCLDTDVDTTPTAHLFTASKARWEQGLSKVPHFDRLPS